jgi:uncharacterized FlaG/YvyC family protein
MNVMNIVENFNSKMTGQINSNHSGRVAVTERADSIQSGKEVVKPEDIKMAVSELNKLAGSFNEKVRFDLDDKTNRIIIKLINRIPMKLSVRSRQNTQSGCLNIFRSIWVFLLMNQGK